MFKLLIIINHPVDLLSLFMTVVVAVFIDHKKQDDKGDSKRNGKSQCIDSGIELVSLQKSEGSFNIVPEHNCWSDLGLGP